MAGRQGAATKRASAEERAAEEQIEADRAELEAERREFDAATKKRQKELAEIEATLEARRVELEEESAELEAERDPVDPEVQRIERLRDSIKRANGGGIRLTVFRLIEGEPVLLPVPRIQLGDAEIEEYREKVAQAHGGGRFRVQFRDPSGQFLGAPAEFPVDGPPKRVEGGPGGAAAAAAEAGAPSARELELLARLEAAEREKKAAADAAAMVAAIAAANAPLVARLEAFERARAAEGPKEIKPTPLESLMLAQVGAEQKARLESKGEPSAEVKALTAKIDGLLADAAREKEEARKNEAKRDRERLEKQIADLRELITAKPTKEPEDQFVQFMREKQKLEMFAESIKPKDGPRSKAVDKAIERMTDRFAESLMPMLDKKVDGIIASVMGTPAAGSGTPGKKKDGKAEDPAEFGRWLLAEFKKGFTVAGKKDDIGQMLVDFPEHMDKLAGVRDREALIELLTAVSGYDKATITEALTVGEWAKADPKLHELRRTIKAICDEVDAAEAAEKKKKAEQAQGDAENADDEEDDADEEDEDEDADEGEEDEGEDEPAPAVEPVKPDAAPPAAPTNGSEPG